MCGIIAGCSTNNIVSDILKGLAAIEYRGYDSAGLSCLINNQLIVRKSIGNVEKLRNLAHNLNSKNVIAHTRWATHGAVNTTNAHPHTSSNISIVHNGIIDNFLDIQAMLIEQGYTFESDTDSEVIAHLFHNELKSKKTQNALQSTISQLKGSFSIVIIDQNQPEQLYAACCNSPLILGSNSSSHWLASDAFAIVNMTKNIYQVPDQSIIYITPNSFTITDFSGKLLDQKNLKPINISLREHYDKGNYKHYMLKEINQQPQIWEKMIKDNLPNSQKIIPKKPKHIHIIGCGSSFHAAVTAQYWFESIAKCPTKIHIASEYNYRTISVPQDCLLIIPSQSGETADALLALKKAKNLNYSATLALCNVAHSTLARMADATLPLTCGPEVGVASTKAFTSQLWAFFFLAQYWSQNTIDFKQSNIAKKAQSILDKPQIFIKIAEVLAQHNNIIFIGQGLGFPTALEAALKLKEISYIHAHAYPSGELKHGPLALVDSNLPVLASVMLCNDTKRSISHLKEITARSGKLIILHQNQQEIVSNFKNSYLIRIPECEPSLAPMLFAIAYQLIAYYVAIKLNRAIDQPRNLAKSVTVS